MNVNRLALNVSKTNFTLFHSCKLKPNQSFSVKLDAAMIKHADCAKCLGITFDSYLTWKNTLMSFA